MDSTDGHRSRRNVLRARSPGSTSDSTDSPLDLTAWKLGIPANQDQAIAWAHAHGFQSAEPTLRKSLDGKKRI